jgi:hypothetical protein
MANLLYGSAALYGLLTQNIPISSKSLDRMASENYAQTFLVSFLSYCLNRVRKFILL